MMVRSSTAWRTTVAKTFAGLVLFFTSQLGFALSNKDLVFDHILPEQLESIGYINCIGQDSMGFMWFGGEKGLARYDGYEVKLYNKNEHNIHSIANSYITNILLDNAGDLWVSSRGGLHRYDPAIDGFVNYRVESEDNELANTINSINDFIDVQEASTEPGALVSSKFWLATRAGLYSFDKNTSKFSKTSFDRQEDSSATVQAIMSLARDAKGIVWLGYESAGVKSFDPVANKLTSYVYDASQPGGPSSNEIRKVYVDSANRVWVGTYGKGLNLYKRSMDAFKHYLNLESEKKDVIWDILEDSEGRLWVGTGDSISYFDDKTARFTSYSHTEGDPDSLGNYVVNTVFEDAVGDIWLGFFPSGVDKINKRASAFQNYTFDKYDDSSISDGGVLTTFEDPKGNIWVGAGYGLSYLDRSTGKFKRYDHVPDDNRTPSGMTVLSIIEDHEETVWMGIWSGGLNRYDKKTGLFKYYMPEKGNPKSIVGKEPWYVMEDSNNDIWVATEKGVARYNRDTDDFTRFAPQAGAYNTTPTLYTRVIYEDARENLWIGTIDGLMLLDRRTGKFKRYVHDTEDSTSISENYVLSIYEDSRANLWVGTADSGLNLMDRDRETFQSYSVDDGLPNNTITGIVEDNNGTIWLSTHKGLSSFSSDAMQFRNFDSRHGIKGNLFNRNSPAKLRSGELVFGHTKGLVIFDPNNLEGNKHLPNVVLTDFQLFNKSIVPASEKSPLTDSITTASQIILTHQQSVISFTFAALNYRSPEDNQYEFRMLGFEDEWRNAGSIRMATYTNLDPGDYIFEVKGSNNEALWNESPKRIALEILPPWWKTWWAYSLYVLLVLLAILSVIIYLIRKRQFVERQNRILETKVAERTQELRGKNQDIQAMLNNMRQGLFTVEEGMLIHDEYSNYLESIFETQNIGGEDVVALLFDKADLSPNVIDQACTALQTIIGEAHFNFVFNAHLLPERYNWQGCEGAKCLALDWNPILVGEHVIKMMVTVRDVTLLTQMEAEREMQKRELSIVGQLLKISEAKYVGFNKTTLQYINENKTILESEVDDREKGLARLFRNMHTVKGNSRTLGLSYIADCTHLIENNFSQLIDKPNATWNMEQLLEDLEGLSKLVQEYNAIYENVLGRELQVSEEPSGAWLSDTTLTQIKSCLSDLNAELKTPSHINKLQSLKTMILNSEGVVLPEVIEATLTALPSIAMELGKSAPKVNIQDNQIHFHPSSHSLLSSIFTHLLRNSLDHGIEPAAERQTLGKPKQPTISIDVHKEPDQAQVRIITQDDGRGINIERLYQKGLENKKWQATDELQISQIAALIFESGVSTKETVTDISGRGVGMDAVKQFLVEQGGDIEIVLADEQYSDQCFVPVKFSIVLPEKYILDT